MNKRVGTIIACGALMVCFAFALCGCSSSTYEPTMKSATVSSPAIKTNGVLSVGINSDNAPMSSKSGSTYVGIDVDVAAAIADELGLKVQYVAVDSDPASALASGKIDIMMGIEKGNSTSTIWKSEEYIQDSVVLFAAKSNATAPSKGSGALIAVQTASLSNWAISGIFDSSEIVSETDLMTAFKDLSSGKANFVAADSAVGLYAANLAGMTVYPIAVIDDVAGYCVGVSSTNSTLANSITTALSTLKKGGNIDIIQKRWLGQTVDLSKVTVIKSEEKAS